MHLEIQVALNFFISHLYNKLPRRRVNLFGEELERALKMKFANHWYPDKPMKGSAYRCLKTGNPTDPVLERAASDANVSINDILENLPIDMSVWIDPGEVSYRIGEKGQMKILWSEHSGDQMDEINDREVTKIGTFNPDAQIFQPIEAARKSVSPYNRGGLQQSPDGSPFAGIVACGKVNGLVAAPPQILQQQQQQQQQIQQQQQQPIVSAATPVWSPHTNPNQPQMMTTAAFAQTKFGSTKLKTSSKRTHRMSPTEFSNYIKQRAIQQQQQKAAQQQQAVGSLGGNGVNSGAFLPRPRSLSPQDFGPFGPSTNNGLYNNITSMNGGGQEKYNPFETAIWSSPSPTGGLGNNNNGGGTPNSATSPNNGFLNGGGLQQPHPFDSNNRQLLEGLSLGLNAVPYNRQYQHLLVAN